MNFDTVIDRKGTYCTQWDYVKDRFGKDGLLAFTISDMDFQAPKEIIEALIKRVNHASEASDDCLPDPCNIIPCIFPQMVSDRLHHRSAHMPADSKHNTQTP